MAGVEAVVDQLVQNSGERGWIYASAEEELISTHSESVIDLRDELRSRIDRSGSALSTVQRSHLSLTLDTLERLIRVGVRREPAPLLRLAPEDAEIDEGLRVYELPASLCDQGLGLRDAHDGHGFAESMRPRHPYRYGALHDPSPGQRHEIDRAVVLTQRGAKNYYHAMIDVFFTVHLARRATSSLKDLPIVLPQTMPNVARLITDIFDDTNAPILNIEAARIQRPCFVERTWRVPGADVRSFRELLRRLSADTPPPIDTRKLYFSRLDARARAMLNESDVAAELQRVGFATVRAGDHGLTEQWSMGAGADVLAGPHGAALTNMILMQPGSRVVEIVPPGLNRDVFIRLAAAFDLDYVAVHGDGTQFTDWTVDPSTVLGALR